MNRLKWKLGSVYLEIVIILMQDRCTVCMEHTICLEINLDAPDVCHMESLFDLFRNIVSFVARYVHGLCLMHNSLRKHFGSTYCVTPQCYGCINHVHSISIIIYSKHIMIIISLEPCHSMQKCVLNCLK